MQPASSPVLDRYCGIQRLPEFKAGQPLGSEEGFFKFGTNAICYGRSAGETVPHVNGRMFDAATRTSYNPDTVFLPFDLTQVVNNLRYERYTSSSEARRWLETSWAKDFYYRLRPLFPVSFRKHLQKMYLRGWEDIRFPHWPIDRSVDVLCESLLVLAMQALQTKRLPFIWFWPEGRKACAIVTHDVETTAGRDFCERLMDIDDEFGIKASFQVVPEKRYVVPASYLASINDRGFEINVQGLDHDGNLFQNRESFLAAARKINQYAESYGAKGFRSPVLYRNVDWFQDLNFSYDMSVPNVARLEAQRGGCCTLMPYVLPGGMLELPLTTIEDYTLFHILNDYSITIWKQQMDLIRQGNGLISFIIHPDYVIADKVQGVYRELLREVARLRSEENVWVTLPRDVDRWWRDRSAMKLVPQGNGWRVEGPGCERATVAYACLDGHRLRYEF